MGVIDEGAIVPSQHNPHHNPFTPGSETIL